MKKNSIKPTYILFALLIPVVVFVYFFKILAKKKVSENVVDREDFDFIPEQEVVPQNGLNERQLSILEYMRENDGVGRVSDMVKLFSQTDRTLRRDLNKLEGLGVVNRSGSTKSVVYSLSK